MKDHYRANYQDEAMRFVRLNPTPEQAAEWLYQQQVKGRMHMREALSYLCAKEAHRRGSDDLREFATLIRDTSAEDE